MSRSQIKPLKICMLLVVLCTAGTVSADQLADLIKAQQYSQAVTYVDQSVPASSRTLDVWLSYAQALEKSGAPSEKILAALTEARTKNANDLRVQEALGSYYLQRKNYQEAIKYYQKWFIIERNPKAAEGLAICAAKLKQWDKAQDAAESAVKLDPVSTIEARRVLAEIYFTNKDFATAIPQLETILQKDSTDADSWKKLMRCYLEGAQNDKAVNAAKHVASLDKKDVPSRQKLAEYYYFFGKKEGNDEYNTLLELSQLMPTDIKVFKRLYQISSERKQKQEAIGYLRSMIKLDSTDVATYKALGGLLYEEKGYDEALAVYRNAVKRDPAITGIYRNYIAMLQDKKLDDELMLVAPKAVAVGEIDTASCNVVGAIYKKKNRCKDAIGFFQKALQLDGRNIALLTSLAECQFAAGFQSDALMTYQQVVLLNPNSRDEYKSIGDMLISMKKTDEAMDNYRKYLEKVPGDETVSAAVAHYLYEKKSYKDALPLFEKIKDAKLKTGTYYLELANSYYQTTGYAKAAENYEEVIKQNPMRPMPEVLRSLAESYEKAGKPLEAARVYDAYVKLPNTNDAEIHFKRASLRESSDPKTAIAIYKANTMLFVSDARNYVRLGMLLSTDAAQAPAAIAALEKASNLLPSDTLVMQKLSDLYHSTGNSEKELAVSLKLSSINTTNQVANVRSGTILYTKKEYTRAVPYLEKSVGSIAAAKDTVLLAMLAESYMQGKDYAKAVDGYARLKDLQPDNTKTWLAYLAAAEAAGNAPKVADAKTGLARIDRKTATANAGSVDARVRLADYLYTNNVLDSARTVYKELAVLTPKDKLVFTRLIDIAQKKADTTDAIACLQKYVVLDPADAKSFALLGDLLYSRKSNDEAVVQYRAAWRIDTTQVSILHNYGTILAVSGTDVEAEKILAAAVKYNKADAAMCFALGKLYQKKGQFVPALAMYKKTSDLDPKNNEALLLVGDCQVALNDTMNALITYEQVVMLNDKFARAYKSYGDLQLRLGKKADAVKSYQKYIELSGTSDEKAAKVIGLYKYDQKQYQDAITYLNMVKTPALQDESWQLALGDASYQTGNFKRTTELYAQLRTRQNVALNKKILRPLGESYEKIGENEKAAEVYNAYTSIPGVTDADASYLKAFLREKTNPKAAEVLYLANTKAYPKDSRNFIKLGLMYSTAPITFAKAAEMLSVGSDLVPNDTSILFKLAHLWNALKNDDRELATYGKLLVIDKQNIEANRRTADLLLKAKQYDKAIPNLEILLAKSPDDAELMLKLSACYIKTGDKEKGAALMSKAQSMKKGDVDLLIQLYGVYKELGNAPEAEHAIVQIIAAKKEAKYRLMYAADLAELNRLAEAYAQVDTIVKADPSNIPALLLAGKILKLQNKLDDASESFKTVLYIDDKNVVANYERGELYRLNKEFPRAESYYTKALQTDPNYALAELGLARVLKAQNKTEEFKVHLDKAKALDPNNPEVKKELAQ